MRRCLLMLLLCFLALPWPVAAQSGNVIRIEPTPKLSVYRSAHYRIYTTLSRSEAVPYGRHMDALHSQYVKRFCGLAEKHFEPMPLYLFETEQQYKRFLAEHDINGAHSGGMFFVTHKIEGLATWVQRSNRRETYEVLQHEGFHQFAWHAFGARLPVWLNEGLAQYFEDAVLTDGKMSLGLANSARIKRVQAALTSRQFIPTPRLLALSNQDWAKHLRNDPTHASLAYAQAWSLTYYLIHGDDGRHKPALLEYLQRLAEGDNPDAAEIMTFGTGGFASLANPWQRFARSQQPDDVTAAKDRLAFLGTGLRVLAEQGQPMPTDVEELRQSLRSMGFRMQQTESGVTQEYNAQSDEVYQYTRAGRGDRAFVLIRPERSGMPPRITAPGLQPQPTLVWYRDREGKLAQEIVYR